MKSLSYFLFYVGVIGCGDYGDEEEIRGVFPDDTSGLANQSDQQTPKDGVGTDIAECISAFHDELVSGALNSEGSEHKPIY